MEIHKIFHFVFLTFFIVSCEKEPLQSTEDKISETMFLEVNSDGEIQTYNALPKNRENFEIRSSHNGSDYRLYNSLEEFQNDCSELRSSSELEATGGIGYSLSNMNYFGAYLEVVGGEDYVEIVAQNTTYNIIYQETLLISERVFFGIATEKQMFNITFNKVNHSYDETIKSTNVLVGYCDFIKEVDTDGDGVPDDEDLLPNSNMEENVVIENCDSSVENRALGEGYMLSDKIDEVEARNYKNHGQFVRETAHYLHSLVEEGIITYKEKDRIMSCAGSSSIGKYSNKVLHRRD